MSADPTDVVLSVAVVSFDGRVLEVFGHRQADRIHVAEITGIADDGDKFVVSTRNQIDHTIVVNDGDVSMRGDLENLIDLVKRSAPNLTEGA